MPTDEITNEELGQALQELPGFRRGFNQRRRILQLGNVLREVRVDYLHLSQGEAARLIGIQQPDLSRLESGTGERGPSMATIGRIIDAYEGYYAKQHRGARMALSLGIKMENAEHHSTTTFEIIGSGS